VCADINYYNTNIYLHTDGYRQWNLHKYSEPLCESFGGRNVECKYRCSIGDTGHIYTSKHGSGDSDDYRDFNSRYDKVCRGDGRGDAFNWFADMRRDESWQQCKPQWIRSLPNYRGVEY